MAGSLHVELVSAERVVWSGDAVRVIARTVAGDVGILPGHAPLLSALSHGVVDIQSTEGETWIAAVSDGFLSVADDRVSVLSEYAELSHEIDVEKARADVERAKAAGEDDTEALDVLRTAEARIRAVEAAS
ncbi:F0F1 ATP synthase subunit epsilon [Nocardioides zeae]|uniref:ATP synthase epsilon chain n=1 Tax=Nocardioides zeae TaxID=1457234 RepID=A0A6P0HCV9_9ACTN|nr:F0F1 ATP synthase subunit epsilon [Nocardioides zeae]NEN76722.1 F0F1 ATP synthase subunit epsilon [Nocardioides zeae]